MRSVNVLDSARAFCRSVMLRVRRTTCVQWAKFAFARLFESDSVQANRAGAFSIRQEEHRFEGLFVGGRNLRDRPSAVKGIRHCFQRFRPICRVLSRTLTFSPQAGDPFRINRT